MPSKAEAIQQAVDYALADLLVSSPVRTPAVVQEADALTRAEVEQVVRRVLKKELEDGVAKVLKRSLKDGDGEGLVTEITGKALAKFFEIMFTRKSTWQKQLSK